MLGYVVAGILAGAVVVGLVLVVLAGGDGDGGADAPAESHIDLATGITAGVEADDRAGTAPPPLRLARLEQAAEAARCELRLELPDEGNGHLSPDQEPPEYETSPPTSGDHDPSPLADGAYLAFPPARNFVHSLEHGRVEVQYDPEIPEQEQLLLKGLIDEDPQGMLLFPNPDMPYAVAATAWQNMLACKQFNDRVFDAIRAFRDTYRGRGPEPVPL